VDASWFYSLLLLTFLVVNEGMSGGVLAEGKRSKGEREGRRWAKGEREMT
jgi:hypothetical protein